MDTPHSQFPRPPCHRCFFKHRNIVSVHVPFRLHNRISFLVLKSREKRQKREKGESDHQHAAMASKQKPRRESTTAEKGSHVEKNLASRMPSHSEGIAVLAKGSDIPGLADTLHVSVHEYTHGGQDRSKPTSTNVDRQEESGHGEVEGPSLEEISKYRGEAQQNSMESIRAAEERYEKAKESARQTLGATAETAKERARQAKDVAYQKATQAKDVAIEKRQKGYNAAKDTLAGAAKTGGDYTGSVAQKAKSNTAQMAAGAKEAAKSVGEPTARKAVQAQDVTLESSKDAAESTGKIAANLKDKAAAAGWTAAHYTTEKTVEGTKAAVRAAQGAAYYTGNKAAEIASKPIIAAKNLAASTGETAKEYTERKKEEAERELEAKRAGIQGKEEGKSETIKGETFQGSQQQSEVGNPSTPIFETVSEIAETIPQPLKSTTGESYQGSQEQRQWEGEQQIDKQQGKGSGLLGAIGETIVEIAQTTKNLVIGSGTGGRIKDVKHGGGDSHVSYEAGHGHRERY